MDPDQTHPDGDDQHRDRPDAETLALWRRLAPAPAAACPDLVILAAYLDGTLAADRRASLEGHLAACDACRAAVVDARAAVAAAETVPVGVVERAAGLADPPGVLARVGIGARSGFWRRAAGWGLAAAASIAVGIAGYDLGRSTQTNDEDALVEMTFGLVTPLEAEAFDVELFALVGEVSR